MEADISMLLKDIELGSVDRKLEAIASLYNLYSKRYSQPHLMDHFSNSMPHALSQHSEIAKIRLSMPLFRIWTQSHLVVPGVQMIA